MSLSKRRSSIIGHWKPAKSTPRHSEVKAATAHSCVRGVGAADTTLAPAANSATVLADSEDVWRWCPPPADSRADECHARHTKTSPWQSTLWGQSQTSLLPCNSRKDCSNSGWLAIHWAYLMTCTCTISSCLERGGPLTRFPSMREMALSYIDGIDFAWA